VLSTAIHGGCRGGFAFARPLIEHVFVARKLRECQQSRMVASDRDGLSQGGRRARIGGRVPHEKAALQRRIEMTDRKIDSLVYELYALTPEEIKVVEGATDKSG